MQERQAPLSPLELAALRRTERAADHGQKADDVAAPERHEDAGDQRAGEAHERFAEADRCPPRTLQL